MPEYHRERGREHDAERQGGEASGEERPRVLRDPDGEHRRGGGEGRRGRRDGDRDGDRLPGEHGDDGRDHESRRLLRMEGGGRYDPGAVREEVRLPDEGEHGGAETRG